MPETRRRWRAVLSRAEGGSNDDTVVDTRRIVPSDGLPPDIVPGDSNNNLDVIRLEGRVYLAWRTSVDHFASEKTRIVVVSRIRIEAADESGLGSRVCHAPAGNLAQ